MDPLLTSNEAALALRVSQKTVLRLIRSGRLPAEKVGRSWRIRASDLPCNRSPGMSDVIYLDDNASNPMHPAVADAMTAAMQNLSGNASSSHTAGVLARKAVEDARGQLAELLDVAPSELVFTSGATESNNLFLRGFPYANGKNRVIISAGEHASISEVAHELQAEGVIDLSVVPLLTSGQLDLEAFAALLDDKVAVVSIVGANSETGVISPLAEVVDLAHGVGAVVHSDVTQLAGRTELNLADLRLDAVSLSAHKMNGPQGVGALFARRSLLRRLRSLNVGGGHENGLRSGTYNTAGIVGMGLAATLAANPADIEHNQRMRDLLQRQLTTIPDVVVHGAHSQRLPNTTNLYFAGAPGDVVLARTPDVAASIGSACHAGAIDPSPTLLAMGLDRDIASSSIRFSTTRFTTATEIEKASQAVLKTVLEVRAQSQEVA